MHNAPETARHSILCATVLGISVFIFAGCNPYDPRLGETPFRCGSEEPLCPDGYTCDVRSAAERICVTSVADPSRPDAGPVDPGDCSGDDGFEPNESINDPTITPIPDFEDSVALVSLQVCPQGDVDIYSFRINDSSKNNAQADVTYMASKGILAVDILNNLGNSIGSGSQVGGNADSIRAQVRNLPVDTYYVQVRGATGVENDYQLNINISGP